MAKVIAICRSREKGTKKKAEVEGVLQEDYGLIGDAHADYCTHRQVSLLAMGSINKIRSLGLNVGPGDFAENITIEGLDLPSLPIGTKVFIGEKAILEITQIGKECHNPCTIYQQVGQCVMPQEGVFARVIKGGVVKRGDTVKILESKVD
ncbi:MOSC domain-containing protein [Chloroflexota bacterium]